MGFDDEDFYKAQQTGMSDTQLYKQAGNSIVVNVLYYIFKNLFKNSINNETDTNNLA
jgi:DNA (cytosine-5)-methyltransferase 1